MICPTPHRHNNARPLLPNDLIKALSLVFGNKVLLEPRIKATVWPGRSASA
jgi:hypothetical protein